jgi:hypothetical protein
LGPAIKVFIDSHLHVFDVAIQVSHSQISLQVNPSLSREIVDSDLRLRVFPIKAQIDAYESGALAEPDDLSDFGAHRNTHLFSPESGAQLTDQQKQKSSACAGGETSVSAVSHRPSSTPCLHCTTSG